MLVLLVLVKLLELLHLSLPELLLLLVQLQLLPHLLLPELLLLLLLLVLLIELLVTGIFISPSTLRFSIVASFPLRLYCIFEVDEESSVLKSILAKVWCFKCLLCI